MATTRKQMFLEKIHDSSFATPVPVTVEEEILDGLGKYVINLTLVDEELTVDKTYEEIVTAIKNGKEPVLINRSESNEEFNIEYYKFICCYDDSDSNRIEFLGAGTLANNDEHGNLVPVGIEFTGFWITPNGVTYYETDLFTN